MRVIWGRRWDWTFKNTSVRRLVSAEGYAYTVAVMKEVADARLLEVRSGQKRPNVANARDVDQDT